MLINTNLLSVCSASWSCSMDETTEMSRLKKFFSSVPSRPMFDWRCGCDSAEPNTDWNNLYAPNATPAPIANVAAVSAAETRLLLLLFHSCRQTEYYIFLELIKEFESKLKLVFLVNKELEWK